MKMNKRIRLYREWRGMHECDLDYSEPPKEALAELKPCPECGKDGHLFMCDPLINSIYANYFITCGNCNYEGPVGETDRDAFSAWGVLWRVVE